MSLIHLTECLAAPGQEDRLRTALEAMIEPSLDEPGCLAYCIYTDPNRPASMVAIEEWTGPQALAEHYSSPHFRHAKQVLELVLAEPMTLRRLVTAPTS
ncbi:putative quinol monooxygenase [Nonomuraea guangzhouensis]|uniref:Quinol monooxygenase n=1 Tax=Nonomuraea guangzhouensis TaxID=1291555 RepID=A0ABW4GPM1_9ACTN|nr:putative quinol monooxygenase [Nonomuraea guangzhouensis]